MNETAVPACELSQYIGNSLLAHDPSQTLMTLNGRQRGTQAKSRDLRSFRLLNEPIAADLVSIWTRQNGVRIQSHRLRCRWMHISVEEGVFKGLATS